MDHPGHKIRTAHSVAMLLRRLQGVEGSAMLDAMEFVGIWDELARVERKWREQMAVGSERRRAGDERLVRQIKRGVAAG